MQGPTEGLPKGEVAMRMSKRVALLLLPSLISAGFATSAAAHSHFGGRHHQHVTAAVATTTTTEPPIDKAPATSTADGLSPPPGYTASQLTFDDQFKGTSLDTSKWTSSLAGEGGANWNGGGLPRGWSGTGSTGQTAYNPANVVVDNGLSLDLDYNDTYSSLGYNTEGGVISTFNKFTFTSGYVQVRAEMPDVSDGQWPAIWLLPNGATTGSEEIDMDEGGMAPSGYGWPSTLPIDQTYAPNYHQPDNAQTISLAGDAPPSDLSSSYHTYGMKLDAGKSVTFYVDGTLMATQTLGITEEPWEIIINMAEVAHGIGLWHQPAPNDISTLPTSTLKVAEVQVYNSTPLFGATP
jgi:beta-glucanase (GH16 family)